MIISFQKTLRDALKKMSKEGKKSLIIGDEGNIFKGILSDGDIRKALLKGKNLKTKIKDIYNKKASFLYEDEYQEKIAKDIFQKKRFDIIPIIKRNNELVKILHWYDFFQTKRVSQNLKDCPLIIMAGGKGTRLKPFTQILPKPLIPVNNKTVLERIIEPFFNSGVKDYYLTVNYKAKILKAFFEELDPEYNVQFIEEKKPLGTAGSLKNIPRKIKTPFLITNCDVIFQLDCHELVDFHKTNKFDLTLVASTKEITIPYGVCKTNKEGVLENIDEKPTFDYLVNTGLYVINPSIIKYIPDDKYFDMPQLIETAKNNGNTIGVFPIDETQWVDVGQWEEYEKAKSRLE